MPGNGHLWMRSGAVTVAAAISGSVLGGLTGYQVTRMDPPRLILRQAGNADASGEGSEADIPLTNGGTTPVEVVGASLSGQGARVGPAAPVVDIPPGATEFIVLDFTTPDGCSASAIDPAVPPVPITVFARPPGGTTRQVPVLITGTPAGLLDACSR
jgi:hypothetical protein